MLATPAVSQTSDKWEDQEAKAKHDAAAWQVQHGQVISRISAGMIADREHSQCVMAILVRNGPALRL